MSRIHVVPPGKSVNLKDFDPGDTGGLEHDAARDAMAKDLERLAGLQELLYVAAANAVLVVLQGMDTSGKDGTIRHVFYGVSPLGCSVAAFKAPSEEELSHDYLWRIHKACPPKGMLTIFNRSHYESVLVERIHKIADRERIQQRYGEINAFEEMLVREGTIIVKLFLHISKDEQKQRLEERIAEPDKQWKVNPGDWQERERWGDYQDAYEDMLNRTSTDAAPWTIVPADHKWYRNYIVAKRLIDVLEDYEDGWRKALLARGKAQMDAMEAWRKSGAAQT